MKRTYAISDLRTITPYMKRRLIRHLISNSGGHLFGAAVVTKGTTLADPRIFNCRLGVRKNLKGGKSPAEGKPNLITVWDRKKEQYRTLNMSKVVYITFRGVKYLFQ